MCGFNFYNSVRVKIDPMGHCMKVKKVSQVLVCPVKSYIMRQML